MKDNHQLALLKTLLKSYFSEELEYDETPTAAKKRLDLRNAILELTNNEN